MVVLENNDYFETTCPHCRSKLGIHQGDISHNDVSNPEFEVKCVVCGTKFGVEGSLIPKAWMRSIVPKEH